MSQTDSIVARIMRIRNGMILDADAEALIRREIAPYLPQNTSAVCPYRGPFGCRCEPGECKYRPALSQSSPATATLKACPFCGSAKVDYIGAPGNGYRVECKGCLAQSPWGDYGYQVQAQWNRRDGLAQTPDHAARDAAYEKHAKRIFGTRPRSLDSMTDFYSGWDAALAASPDSSTDREGK
jgi:Lar family restriction alleviation protein